MSGSEDALLPRSTFVAAAVAIVLIGGLASSIVMWNNAKSSIADSTTKIQETDALIEAKRQELAPFERELEMLQDQTGLLARGKMCVTNPSDGPVVIRKLAVVFLDEAGAFQTFNSEAYGDGLWTIEAGHARQALAFPRGNWDGSVTYYAMWLEAAGRDGPRAQVWPLDPEYCVRLPWGG